MSEKTFPRMVLGTVVVVRDGKQKTPPIGEPFEFTQTELDDIARLTPSAVRKLTDETAGGKGKGRGKGATPPPVENGGDEGAAGDDDDAGGEGEDGSNGDAGSDDDEDEL